MQNLKKKKNSEKNPRKAFLVKCELTSERNRAVQSDFTPFSEQKQRDEKPSSRIKSKFEDGRIKTLLEFCHSMKVRHMLPIRFLRKSLGTDN